MRGRAYSFLGVSLAVLIACAAVTVTAADPKAPSAPRLVTNLQGVEVLSWTVPVSAAVLAGYVPGQKVSTDNGATFAAIAGLSCTGAGNSQACTAPFPATVKGTYQTKVQICDTQGAKQKCSTSATAAIDFLPSPATPSTPACPNCGPAPAPTGTISLAAPQPGAVIGGASEMVVNFTGTVTAAGVRIEIRDLGGAVVAPAITTIDAQAATWVAFRPTVPLLVPNGTYDLVALAAGAAPTAAVRVSVINSTLPGPNPTPTPTPIPTPTPVPVTATLVSPAAGAALSGIADVTFDTTGVVYRAELTVLDLNDQFICTCPARMVSGAPTGQRWRVQLDTAKGANQLYAILATAYDQNNLQHASPVRRITFSN